MKYRWASSETYSVPIFYLYFYTNLFLGVKYSGEIELYNLDLAPFPTLLVCQIVKFKPDTQPKTKQLIDTVFTGLLI